MLSQDILARWHQNRSMTCFSVLLVSPFDYALGQARYSKAENRLKELNLSVDLFKKDSQKLKQRALLAEDEMSKGSTKLK